MLGNDMLRHIAEHSQLPFSKYSLSDLLSLQDKSQEERLRHLNGVLHVGISKIVLLLQDLPLGFGTSGPIRSVIEDYMQDLRDLQMNPPSSPELFRECIQTIFARHRGMLGQIADGLRQFQQQIAEGFEPPTGFRFTVLADVCDHVPPVQMIQRTLDEFFTIRTTLRLLIAHCMQLSPGARRYPFGVDGEGMSMPQLRHVGAICLETRPSLILIEAFRHAQFVCERRLGRESPELIVNGVPTRAFVESGIDSPENRFPYVDIHLYFVFFEVLKNAVLTSMRKAGPEEFPEPVLASLISGTSLMEENERTVKITDHGEGINREDMRKVWSYFHSTRKFRNGDIHPSSGARPAGEGDNAARGLGLAVSRVLVRYFGGEIDMHSIPRKGTDVYIYL